MDAPVLRPAETLGDATRLQQEGHRLPSAEASSARNLDEKTATRQSWIRIVLLALFVAFIIFVVFGLR